MSKIYMIADPHFGHKAIGRYRQNIGIYSPEDNERLIRTEWISLIQKRDVVYILGDAAFTKDAVDKYIDLPGTKNLLLGNHDLLPAKSYLRAFNKLLGTISYKGYWLSHCPVHPAELRGKKNIHGHVHNETISDDRYINISCEVLYQNTGSFFLDFLTFRNKIK